MSEKITIKSILSETSWWPINKEFARIFGIDTAVLLMDLSSKQEYFDSINGLDENGFFFNTKENIEIDTTLTAYQQNKSLEKLEEFELVKTVKYGLPLKTYYRVDIVKVNQLLTQLHNNPISEAKDRVRAKHKKIRDRNKESYLKH